MEVNHSTINGRVLAYAPTIEQRSSRFCSHTMARCAWTIHIPVHRQWHCLYCAIGKQSEAINFLLTASRDLDTAKRFFRKMLRDEPLLAPDRIGMDGSGPHPPSLPKAARRVCRPERQRTTKGLRVTTFETAAL